MSAFFGLALGLLAVAVSIFSFGYLRNWEGRKNIGILGFFYNILLLSLTLVFTASNAFFFLVAWEVMALSAYCLVSFEHEKEETRKAGILFLIMSHAGTGLLLIAFLLLATFSGSLDFSAFHLLGSKLPASGTGGGLRFCSSWGSESKPASSPFTCGCRPRTRWRRATSPPSCRAS